MQNKPEALRVAKMLETIINALRVEGPKVEDLIEAKAQTIANYDKQMGITAATHKGAGMAVTLIKEQSKSDNRELRYDKIVAEEKLKAYYSRIDILKAQLNGYQSINRHLDTV